ncbi:MAG: nucleotidyl transferase AbiEii/AbiGii toxin family protein [Candidatus Eisenbacteria sp.]|nr:nucleotidyl transferase AbiEii/AbiGii toxin family protein [Candidatus Eisenbacteria bacterium]
MDRIASWSDTDRADLVRETAAVKNMAPAVVEKDFWVCWVLDKLFGSDPMGRKILFKGGTSLSKVFGLIERFSEDIDLILDWDEVSTEDPMAARSVSKQDAFNKKLLCDTHDYLGRIFLPEVEVLIGGTCRAAIEENPEVVKIGYPAAFSSDYLRPEIQLEVGCLASWVPNEEYEITPYAAEALPQAFERSAVRVRAIKAERTFWEKVTILHHEAHRPQGRLQPKGYSRHYYDVCRMSQSPVKGAAFLDLELLRNVVAFKDKFYHRGWAQYDLAVPGSMRLVPPEYVRRALESDYAEMRFMIYGDVPAFSDLMESIQQPEVEINQLPKP